MDKEERDLFSFYCAEVYLEASLASRFPDKETEAMQPLVESDFHFWALRDKLAKLLLADLGIGTDENFDRQESLWAMKQELLESRKFVREPDLGPYNGIHELDAATRRHFVLLECVEKKFGPDYAKFLESEETNESVAELQRNIEWIRKEINAQMWKSLLINHKDFVIIHHGGQGFKRTAFTNA